MRINLNRFIFNYCKKMDGRTDDTYHLSCCKDVETIIQRQEIIR